MRTLPALLLSCAVLSISAPSLARDADDEVTPSGLTLTPLATPGAQLTNFGTLDGTPNSPQITNPAAMATSPDGTVLAVLTSGYNTMALPTGAADTLHSAEWLMLFRMSAKGAIKIAEVPVPATFAGLAWSPDGKRIVVTQGMLDSVVLFSWDGKAIRADGAPIALGHKEGLGLRVKPAAAGVAWAGSDRLLVANFFNDSVSLIDVASRRVVSETDLRPGKIDPALRGKPGGTYPFRIAMASPTRAVVSVPRDRELVSLDIAGDQLRVVARTTSVAEPTALLALPDGRVLATGDNSDTLIALAADGKSLTEYPTVAFPQTAVAGRPKGLNPNALAIGKAGRLLVTLGGINAVASVDLARTLASPSGTNAQLIRLAPTGWYPDAVAVFGGRLAVANFKGVPGGNPLGCRRVLGTSLPIRPPAGHQANMCCKCKPDRC